MKVLAFIIALECIWYFQVSLRSIVIAREWFSEEVILNASTVKINHKLD
jgi:hypothetical protein